MNELDESAQDKPRPTVEEVVRAAEKGIILDWADNPARYSMLKQSAAPVKGGTPPARHVRRRRAKATI